MMLKSSKFVRLAQGLTRISVPSGSSEWIPSVHHNFPCVSCGFKSRSLVTEVSAQHDQSLDLKLRNIDQDVRRSGRIPRNILEDLVFDFTSARIPPSTSASLTVIKCCGNLVPEELPSIRTQFVQEVWGTLKKLKVPLDISHYNALLRVYLENEHQFSPVDFLTELENSKIEPNRVTFQRLIHYYCNRGDIEGATRILEFMKEKQMSVNENVFNSLIVGHSEAGDMLSAEGIITVMTQTGLSPSSDTYVALICGYAKQGDIEKIKSLLTKCEESDIYLISKDYLDIVYSLAINGHQQHIPYILEKTQKGVNYSQDTINLILRLIVKGLEEAAYLVVPTIPRTTRPDGSLVPIGAFFIKQMVKANRPIDKIVKYVTMLKSDGYYDGGLELATDCALQIPNTKLAYSLFDELKANGTPIRQHYFWPLLVAESSDPTGNGIISVLNKMGDYNLSPSHETLIEYVIPNINGKSSEVLAKLREANISLSATGAGLVHLLVQKNDLDEAAEIISKVPAYYAPELFKRSLTNALFATENLDAYIKIVRYIVENVNRRELIQKDDKTVTVDKIEVLGQFIHDLANYRRFPSLAPHVFECLIEQGLSLSTTTAERLHEKLGENMTPELSQLLSKLTSGELTPVPLVKSQLPRYTPASQMNIPQLEQLIHNLTAKGADTSNLKKQLLQLYYRAKDFEKMTALIDELYANEENEKGVGLYAQLVDVAAYHNKLEEATKYYVKIKEIDPNVTIDDSKLIRYAACLIHHDKLNEAMELLSNASRRDVAQKDDNKSFAFNAQCWRLLNLLAERGKTEELNALFNLLVKDNFVKITNVLLGPLIKVHLVNNDCAKAVETFEWCVNQYRSTPWKSELTARLIQNEDAENLQKITDLSTSIHGEINSLYDLVFAFVECGRTRQARKILETPGLHARSQRINTICERYQQEGMVKPLEDLRDVTKDLNHIDRSDIYYQLLLSYVKQDDPNKALGLWTQMQEEDLLPPEKFLAALGNYLKRSGLEVPFAIPKIADDAEDDHNSRPVRRTERAPNKKVNNFRQTILDGKIDEALNIKVNSSSTFFSANDLSLLLEKLVQAERFDEAKKLCTEMLVGNQQPIPRIFRYFLNKIANSGDIDGLNEIGSNMDKEMKKLLSFDNRVCHANLVAGKASDYLDALENEIDTANDENLGAIAEKFPRGGVVGILDNHPELMEKYERIADKYSNRGIIGPYNVLWGQYFIKGEDEKAEVIWEKYLKGAPRIMFQRVVQNARETNNEDLIKKLIEHLKTSNVTDGALGNAYSCYLDISVAGGDKEKAIELFEKAIKEIPIDRINRTAVLRVKECYDALNKPFNYTIPAKSKTANAPNDE